MVKRRSFEDELSPDATAYLHTGRAGPPSPSLTTKEIVTAEQTPPVGRDMSTQQLLAVLPRLPDNALTPLTVRINPAVATALMQASMVRKFQQQTPWSQKDIVSEALEEWLQSRGFLNGSIPRRN